MTKTIADIQTTIDALPQVPRDDLVAFWNKRNGHAPPKGCGRTLLELAEAYAIQTQRFGGLKPRHRRKLENNSFENSNGVVGPKIQKSRQLAKGSRLVRAWNGRTHHVEVVDGGYIWSGSKYQSLSAIAKQITGAHWSGPRFFGL